jgi:hypothetical protein
MIDWIDLIFPTTHVMNYIKFNNFFNYIIKIYAHKIEYQPKI